MNMLQTIASYFEAFPPEVAVFLVSMMPVLEQRVGIPLAILVYNMPVLKAYVLVMAGNLGPVMLLSYFAQNFHDYVIRNSQSVTSRYWLKKLKEAQDAFQKYEKYGLWGLMLFVALPIPGSGIFTGAMIAFLMGVPFKHSWPYLLFAVLLSGIFSVFVSVGLEKIIF